jgi:hypothetical protein
MDEAEEIHDDEFKVDDDAAAAGLDFSFDDENEDDAFDKDK